MLHRLVVHKYLLSRKWKETRANPHISLNSSTLIFLLFAIAYFISLSCGAVCIYTAALYIKQNFHEIQLSLAVAAVLARSLAGAEKGRVKK
jgi:hypothetical protein